MTKESGGIGEGDIAPEPAHSIDQPGTDEEPTPLERREAAWDAKKREIAERMPDLSEGMTETVIAFEMHDLPVLDASEGGTGEGKFYTPSVEVGVKNVPDMRFKDQEVVAGGRGISQDELLTWKTDTGAISDAGVDAYIVATRPGDQRTAAFKQWMAETVDILGDRIIALLDEFYETRTKEVPDDQRLIALQLGINESWTVLCGLPEEHFDAAEAIPERTPQDADRTLKRRQREMKFFTKFLKWRYLNGATSRSNDEPEGDALPHDET